MSDTTTTRRVLSGSKEIIDGAMTVASCTKRRLSIYSHELTGNIYESEEFLSAITQLALSTKLAQVRVIVARPRIAINNASKFIALARRISTVIKLRTPDEDAKHPEETYMVADEQAIIYQPSQSRWEGILDTYAPHLARRYQASFDELWERCVPDTEFRRLHI